MLSQTVHSNSGINSMNIKLKHCCGQCCAGASTMSGMKKGAAKVIASKDSCANFTHCYGHAINFGVGDTIKLCQLMVSALDVMQKIPKLNKKSPKRDALFGKLKTAHSSDTSGFCVLCPTR